MTIELLLIIVVAAFLVLIMLEAPVGLAIGIAGAVGIALLSGFPSALKIAATTPFSAVSKYSLFVVPMYILLGTLIANAGIGAGIYRAVNRVVRRLPGGLAATAVAATAMFSGISGSSAADVATFGRISVSEMTRYGYSRSYAAAVVAAAGTFAALIPPSVTLVIYAIIAEESVGAMILAGVVPGIASALVLMLFVIARAALRHPGTHGDAVDSSAAADAVLRAVEDRAVLREQRRANRRDGIAIVYAAVLFLIVIGGLYGGVFTATESGAVGAFAAAVIAIIASRANRVSLRTLLVDSLRETSTVSSMIFLLLIGGGIFAFFVASSGIPFRVSEWATTLAVDPLVVVAIFLVVLLVLGTVLDGLSIMVLTVPLAAPIVTGFGFEGIWFGVLVLKTVEIGLITPPVGLNGFIISGIARVPVVDVFKRLVPFVVLDLIVTAVFFFFPELILWLPRQAGLL